MSPGLAGGRLERKQILAGVIGNTLEWYDFAVYGFLAPIIATLRMPEMMGEPLRW